MEEIIYFVGYFLMTLAYVVMGVWTLIILIMEKLEERKNSKKKS